MLKIHDKKSFRKDYKKVRSSGKQLSKLADVINRLQKENRCPKDIATML